MWSMTYFETTEFESPEYKNLIEEIQKNQHKLPDIKIENGYIFKRTKPETELNSVELPCKL